MNSKRGSILLEATMAVVLLTIAFVAVAHLLALAARQKREVQWRTLARLEATNAVERLMARPWDELTPQITDVSLSEFATERLPQARLGIQIHPVQGEIPTKKIQVRVDWVNLVGQRGQPVELVAWKHNIPIQ